jgi:orotate phosphoribosyltransferase
MKSTLYRFAKDIANTSLQIKAIKLNTEDPFQWASGYRMPIYNDNRMMLGQYKDRMLVAEGFKGLIDSERISIDYIAGTSTAGIAPAASAASLLRVPLVIMEGGDIFSLDSTFGVSTAEDYDAVASTCPWAIPMGVSVANKEKLPFMYVRQSKKTHGLKQQIEGNPQEGQKVFLIDHTVGESYLDNAADALKEKGLIVTGTFSSDISNRLRKTDVCKKNVLVIEDLISTGGSSVKEVLAYREKGANVTHCMSIFNYGLDDAVRQFKEENCEVRSLLTYDILLDVAKETGYLTDEQVKLLEEWRADPFNWGEKHGFPKAEKGGN